VAGICLLALVVCGRAGASIGPNIARDGSFEAARPGGMPTGWTGSAGVGADAAVRHDGRLALRVSFGAPGSANAASPAYNLPGPCDLYVLTFWYRAEGFGKSMAYEGVNASMRVEWLSADGKSVASESLGFPYGAMDWCTFCYTLAAPKAARKFRLLFGGSANEQGEASTFWIDGLMMRPIVLPAKPLATVRLYNVARDRLYPARTTIRPVVDDHAIERRAVVVNPLYQHQPLYPIDGYYRKDLPAGLYRLTFRMKAAAPVANAVAVVLDVSRHPGPLSHLAKRTVPASAFRQPQAYHNIELAFVHPGGEKQSIQFRAHWPGKVKLWLDTVKLEALEVFGDEKISESEFYFSWDEPPQKYAEADPDRIRGRNPPDIPPPAPAGKQRYLEELEKWFDTKKETYHYYLNQQKPYPNTGVYVSGARWFAFMYKAKGQEQYAEDALRCLKTLHGMNFSPEAKKDPYYRLRSWHSFMTLFYVDQWLTGYEKYDNEGKKLLSEMCALHSIPLPTNDTWGAHNRMFGRGMLGEILMKFVPAYAELQDKRALIEKLWNYWYGPGSTNENSSHYNALGIRYLMTWADARGELAQVLANPAVRSMFDRYLGQVFPAGTIPHYGDGNGWNVSWGHWVYLFELMGRHSRNGEYRWAAQRIFDYSLRHIENLSSWAYTGEHAMESLQLAYLYADESVQPQPPQQRLRLLNRPGLRLLLGDERKKRGQAFEFTATTMPAKLAMHSGTGRDALSVLFELVAHGGHNPGSPSQLISLMDNGSVLLMASGYMDRQRYDSNMVMVEDYEGHPLLHPAEHIPGDSSIAAYASEKVRVPHAEEMPNCSFARIEIANYANYKATLRRDVLLAGKRLVVVRDRFVRLEDLRPAAARGVPLKMYIAPVYNVGHIGPEAGPNWVNTYMGDFVGVRDIRPNGPVYTRWKNPRRDLLIYFTPGQNRKLEVFDRRCYDSTTPLRFMLRQAWRGPVKPRQPVVFTALLIPHEEFSLPSSVADGVEVLLDTDTAFAGLLREGQHTHVVFLQEGNETLQAGPLRTDAMAGYIHLVGDRVIESSAYRANLLEYDGQNLIR